MEKVLWSKSEERQWTATLFVGTLVVYAARVSLPITVVAVGNTYGWSKTESGAVLSSFFWGYATTQIIGGWLADRYGGDRVLGVSTLLWSLLTFFTPQLFKMAYLSVQPMAFIVAVRIVTGVTQGFHFPCMASLVSRRLAGPARGRVLGIVFAGSHAGTVVCGGVGSVVLYIYGWEAVFYLIGSLSLLWWSYLRYLNSLGRFRVVSAAEKSAPLLISMDGDESSSAIVVPKGVASRKHGADSLPWLTLFGARAFWAAFCAHYSGANAYFTLFSWLPTYFTDNYPESKGWFFNVLPNIALVVTSTTAPLFAANLISKGCTVTSVRRLMEGASLAGLAVCLLVVSQLHSYHSALLLFVLGMAFRGLHHGGVSVNPQDFAPNHTGVVFGVMNTAAAIPGFVGVYVAGYILQLTQSWAVVFSVTACQCLVGMTVYSLWGSGEQIV